MKFYLVGGAVRDKLLGVEPKERDWVVVGATAQDMLDMGFRPVGKDFPVFLHPETHEEYALARTERKTAPNTAARLAGIRLLLPVTKKHCGAGGMIFKMILPLEWTGA